ncbi:hypothetical protein EJB05_09628 [Eragrostis curvula]|uniref:F-box domain-containing protein n=1 Tax=Eragrostis curvula TaxID=38414 RepID=A0A5J9W5H0_9POAL|nr:hypothetical protein EJB05_09628 [Eragrostis curvula]
MDFDTDAQLAPTPASNRDWSDLPIDVLTSVFVKLGAIEVLMGAGLVCRSWLEAAKTLDPWRTVDMVHHRLVEEMYDYDSLFALFDHPEKIDGDDLCAMARVAVDRSSRQLEVFLGKKFVTDEHLKYIEDRPTSLKRLSLISCCNVSNEGFSQLITTSPLLEDILLDDCSDVKGDKFYEATGKACVHLKHFRLHGEHVSDEALGIAAMHKLRNLNLQGINVNNDELAAIIDGCPHLETLSDNSTLRAKCAGIKTVELCEYESSESSESDYDFCLFF